MNSALWLDLRRHLAPVDDRQFWSDFLASRLRVEQWDHTSHLRAAWCALATAGDQALPLMRQSIRRLNGAQGVLNTPHGGYHETLTVVWLALVCAARQHKQGASSLDFCLRHAQLHQRELPLRHYSKPRIVSRLARFRFLPPDLLPFPSVTTFAVTPS